MPRSSLFSFLDLPLPKERIALSLSPLSGRHLLRVERRSGTITAMGMAELPSLVKPGDLWIVNASQVIPALCFLHRERSAHKVECLWIRQLNEKEWEVWLYGRKLAVGEILLGEGGFRIRIVEKLPRGFRVIPNLPPLPWLSEYGFPPLPPYIRKQRKKQGMEELIPEDERDYSNPQGCIPGSIAASTAAFHIRPEIRQACEARGARFAEIILHIGPSTFAEVDHLDRPDSTPSSATLPHLIPEYAEIPPSTFALLKETRARRGRIVAIGTTVVRTLEALMNEGSTPPSPRMVDLLIAPGYSFQWVDALLTNFHLPRTTLRLLIAAFAGSELALKAYKTALNLPFFRFYSYGDAMWIE